MAELIDRDFYEAQFARQFGRRARAHMLEFRELLGDPPDINNIPDAFWNKIRAESEDWFYPLLFGIFVASATQHGWEDAAASLAAFGWAKQRSGELAEHWSGKVESKLVGGMIDLVERGQNPLPETTVEEARQAAQIRVRNQPYIPSDEEIDELLDKVFSPNQIAIVAEDETTRARHAGGESAIEELVGISQDDTWEVNPPRVCKICMSLDGLKRSQWPWRYSEGPPSPHFRCKCVIRYEAVPISEAVWRMIESEE